MDPDFPVNLDITPGAQTSEPARTQLLHFGGGVLFVAVLTLAGTTEIPPAVLITALICAALITIAPTLHYIASRKAVKCEQLRSEAEIHKQVVAKQAAAAREASRTA